MCRSTVEQYSLAKLGPDLRHVVRHCVAFSPDPWVLSSCGPMNLRFSSLCIATVLSLSCSGAQEPEQVELKVVTDSSELGPVTTNLGYEVELTGATIVVEDFTFAIAGELLTRSPIPSLYDWAIPSAHAHPGHHSGGDVTGELRGRFVLDWFENSGTSIGTATLLDGTYTSANLRFARGGEELEGEDTNEETSYSAQLSGLATRDDVVIEFQAFIDLAESELIGIPFEVDVHEDSVESLGVQLKTLDELEGDTLFDDVDFQALDADDDQLVRISADAGSKRVLDAYLAISRALQTHDNYEVVAR